MCSYLVRSRCPEWTHSSNPAHEQLLQPALYQCEVTMTQTQLISDSGEECVLFNQTLTLWWILIIYPRCWIKKNKQITYIGKIISILVQMFTNVFINYLWLFDVQIVLVNLEIYQQASVQKLHRSIKTMTMVRENDYAIPNNAMCVNLHLSIALINVGLGTKMRIYIYMSPSLIRCVI